MNYAQLLAWVNNPARTRGELQAACAGLGLNQAGNLNTLRTRLQTHIAAQPDVMAASPFIPVGWVAPVIMTHPTPQRNTVAWMLGVGLVIAIIALLALFVRRVDTVTIVGQLDAQATQVAAQQTQIAQLQFTPTATSTSTPRPSATSTSTITGTAGLTIADFAQMWATSPKDEGPGPLMIKLDRVFDNGGWHYGGQSATGNWTVPAGSILWTDLKFTPVYLAGTQKTVNRTTEFVMLRAQGEWAIYAIYADVDIITPGRYLKTDRVLSPAQDLAGW